MDPEGIALTQMSPRATAPPQAPRRVTSKRIIEILGTEVKSKSLLINLLHRAGYPALARALDAYEKKRVAAAA